MANEISYYLRKVLSTLERLCFHFGKLVSDIATLSFLEGLFPFWKGFVSILES